MALRNTGKADASKKSAPKAPAKATRPAPAKAPAKAGPAKAPAKSTALVRTGKKAIAKGGGLAALAGLAGKGTENITQQDKGMPYLKILQSMSPEIAKKNDRYVEGATAGMFYHTGNRELFNEGVRIVPIYFKSVVQEWWPRNHANKGLVATYETMNEAKRKKKHEGTNLNLTHMHFVLMWSEDKEEYIPCIFACDRTKLSPSKTLLGLIDNYTLEFNGEQFKAPAFSRSYTLETTEQQKGDYTFYNFSVYPGEDVYDDEEFVQYCSRLVDDFEKGAVQVDYSMGEGVHNGEDDSADIAEDDV